MSSRPVRLYWWRWRPPDRLNFGDELSAPIIRRISGREVEWTPLEECELVAAGSVLGAVFTKRRRNPPKIWGTGFMWPPKGTDSTVDLSTVAVRGRLSGARLSSPPDTFGDPGVLADLLLERIPRKAYVVGLVAHYLDVDAPVFVELRKTGYRVDWIPVTLPPDEVAARIAACEVVLSSSLHGLIVADALGVPSLHLRASDAVGGGEFKFRDYYSAFEARKYRSVSPSELQDLSTLEIASLVESESSPPVGIDSLRWNLVKTLTRLLEQ